MPAVTSESKGPPFVRCSFSVFSSPCRAPTLRNTIGSLGRETGLREPSEGPSRALGIFPRYGGHFNGISQQRIRLRSSHREGGEGGILNSRAPSVYLSVCAHFGFRIDPLCCIIGGKRLQFQSNKANAGHILRAYC